MRSPIKFDASRMGSLAKCAYRAVVAGWLCPREIVWGDWDRVHEGGWGGGGLGGVEVGEVG